VLLDMARRSATSATGRSAAIRYLQNLLRRKDVAAVTHEEGRAGLASLRTEDS
jgi:hypothetical protein